MTYKDYEKETLKAMPAHCYSTFELIINQPKGYKYLGKALSHNFPIDLTFESYFNVIFKVYIYFTSEADLASSFASLKTEIKRTKSRWKKRFESNLLKNAAQLEPYYQLDQQTLDNLSNWETDPTLPLCDFIEFKQRNIDAKANALHLDMRYAILDFLSTLKIDESETVIKKPTGLVSNPLFSMSQSKMPFKDTNLAGDYMSEYQVSDDYFIRTIISPQAFRTYTSLVPSKAKIAIKDLRYLDSLDSRILSYLCSKLTMKNLVQDYRQIVISIGDLAKRFMPSISARSYEQIRARLAKLGTYKVCGVYKGSDDEQERFAFSFGFFNITYVNVQQKTDMNQVLINFDSDFIKFYINQRTIEAPLQLQLLSPEAEMIFFPLHYSRLQSIVNKATDNTYVAQEISAEFNYTYFQSRIIMPVNAKGRPRSIQKNMDLIIAAIEELKHNNMLIKEYSLVDKRTISITFLAPSQRELDTLFEPTDYIDVAPETLNLIELT